MIKKDYSIIPKNKIGVLRVIKAIKVQNGYHWLCDCDCGNKIEYQANQVGHCKRSCGKCSLVKIQKKLKFGEYATNRIIYSYKTKAKNKNLPFTLTEKEYTKLFQSNCYYCEAKPSNCSKTATGNFYYNGIDRLDNNKGYTTENSVPCCNMCNKAKRHIGEFDFLDWIGKVYNKKTEYYQYIQDFSSDNNMYELTNK